LTRSRRGTINGIPTAVVHRRILTGRRSAGIRAGRRVTWTWTGTVESSSGLWSRNPVVAGQLCLVLLLTTLKERVQVLQARILHGLQCTEEKGKVWRTFLVGFKHAPRGIGEINATTSKEGSHLEDSCVVRDDILSGDLPKIKGIEHLVLDFM
jgi:hypothetical protein